MLKDLRKTVLTFTALLGFVSIGLVKDNVDFMGLGLGMGFLTAPFAAANAMEHRFKNQRGNDGGKTS